MQSNFFLSNLDSCNAFFVFGVFKLLRCEQVPVHFLVLSSSPRCFFFLQCTFWRIEALSTYSVFPYVVVISRSMRCTAELRRISGECKLSQCIVWFSAIGGVFHLSTVQFRTIFCACKISATEFSSGERQGSVKYDFQRFVVIFLVFCGALCGLLQCYSWHI